MLKKLAREKLRSYIEFVVDERIRDARVSEQKQLAEALKQDAAVLSSVPKSGTTYALLIVSNYLCLLMDGADAGVVTYDRMINEFLVHSVDGAVKEETFLARLSRHRALWDVTNGKIGRVVHTHNPCIPPETRAVAFLIRHPLDQALSAMHFRFTNRGRSVPDKMSCLESLVDEYRFLVSAQNKVMDRMKDQSIRVRYEDLITNTSREMQRLLRHFGIPVKEQVLLRAIERSHKDQVKEHERRRGRAIVVKNCWQEFQQRQGSFIRNGRPGEWMEDLSKSEARKLSERLAEVNLPEYDLANI